MAVSRSTTAFCLVLVGVSAAGCADVLPKPEYTLVQYPSPIRTEPNGTQIDNRGYPLDSAGYRLDKKTGEIIGFVDYDAKTEGMNSNPIAGYYVSSTGQISAGTVAKPSMGASTGAGYGVGSAQPMPSGMGAPQPSTPVSPAITVPATPPASGAPVPLTPPARQ